MAAEDELDNTIPAKIQVRGVGVTPFDGYAHVVSTVNELIDSKGNAYIAAINPEKLYAALGDEDASPASPAAEASESTDSKE